MIEVENKKVPHSFRNKYLRNSGSVSISTTTPTPINGGGANLDVLKIDDGPDLPVYFYGYALPEIASHDHKELPPK